MTSAHATKILFDGQKAIGVRYQWHGRTTSAFADCEVIISAGAIQSPQILELSGIGNAKHLQDLGITVQAPLAGVGENLADHYISRLSWQLKHNISLNNKARGISFLGEVIKLSLIHI